MGKKQNKKQTIYEFIDDNKNVLMVQHCACDGFALTDGSVNINLYIQNKVGLPGFI